MREFRLEVLESKQGLLAFGEVANEASKDSPLLKPRFTDGKLDGKRAAVTVKRGRNSSNPDDSCVRRS